MSRPLTFFFCKINCLRTKTGYPLLFHICFSTHKEHFVGAFANLRKTTIIFAMYLCLSGKNHLSLADFHEIWYLRSFQKSFKQIQVSLKFEKNSRYSIWRPMYIYDNMSLNYYYNENVLEKFVEKIRTHFYGKYIFFPENRVFMRLCRKIS